MPETIFNFGPSFASDGEKKFDTERRNIIGVDFSLTNLIFAQETSGNYTVVTTSIDKTKPLYVFAIAEATVSSGAGIVVYYITAKLNKTSTPAALIAESDDYNHGGTVNGIEYNVRFTFSASFFTNLGGASITAKLFMKIGNETVKSEHVSGQFAA